MKPNIPKKQKAFLLKECSHCGGNFGPRDFSQTKSVFFPDGYLPICNNCLEKYLIEEDFNWRAVNKICQYSDIPFVPAEFEKLHKINGSKVFPIYAEIFLSEEYEDLGWDDYFNAFKRLQEANAIEEELPGLKEEKRKKLQDRWGLNYDDEALSYMEGLYNGLLMTQNVNGALQGDQALKLCKISYEIDCRIREGADFDKLLASYDKLVKTAEFTPKNVKSANDFDSVGELFRWLEKRGWKNKYYDGVSKDIVDETIANIQNFNQRLYTNESGIGDEITRRIEALKTMQQLEIDESNYYGTNDSEYDLDLYDNDGFESLFKDEEEFNVEID